MRLDELEETVYNFHVAELQNYAVGICGALVHNTNDPQPSEQPGPQNFQQQLEQAVQDEWAVRGDSTSDAMSLQDLSAPHEVANRDPALGSDQVRYQATFVNEVTGETIEVSINYDPTTGRFGTIKPASGR